MNKGRGNDDDNNNVGLVEWCLSADATRETFSQTNRGDSAGAESTADGRSANDIHTYIHTYIHIHKYI